VNPEAYARRVTSPSIPAGCDQDASDRIARSFLLLRIVRGTLMLLFWVAALVGVELGHWPTGAAVVVVLAVVAQAAMVSRNCRRLLRSRGTAGGPTAR